MTARAFLLGLVAGGLGGILMVSFGIGLLFLGPLAIAVGNATRPRPVGAAGTLIAWGATWLALFARVAVGGSVDQTCSDGPELRPWIAINVGLMLGGFGLLAASRHR